MPPSCLLQELPSTSPPRRLAVKSSCCPSPPPPFRFSFPDKRLCFCLDLPTSSLPQFRSWSGLQWESRGEAEGGPALGLSPYLRTKPHPHAMNLDIPLRLSQFSNLKSPYQRMTIVMRAFLDMGERTGLWIAESWGYPLPLILAWARHLTFPSLFPHLFYGTYAVCLIKLYSS